MGWIIQSHCRWFEIIFNISRPRQRAIAQLVTSRSLAPNSRRGRKLPFSSTADPWKGRQSSRWNRRRISFDIFCVSYKKISYCPYQPSCDVCLFKAFRHRNLCVWGCDLARGQYYLVLWRSWLHPWTQPVPGEWWAAPRGVHATTCTAKVGRPLFWSAGPLLSGLPKC